LAALNAVPAHAQAPDSRSSVAQAVAFLDTMSNAYPSSGTPTLPQSYADELGLFATGFVYDAAVTVCAALAAGRIALARRVGDGLLFAQSHDPVYHDGRLRQAYNVGPYVFYGGNPSPYGLVLPDGTANIGWQFGFLGTAVGDMAWPGIALVRLFAATHDRRYLDGERERGVSTIFLPPILAGARSVTQQEGFELAGGAAFIIDGIGAGPTPTAARSLSSDGALAASDFLKR